MFTGIVKEIGKVILFKKLANVYRLEISCEDVTHGVKVGDSIAVNGVCLTVIDYDKGRLAFDVMSETVTRSALGAVRCGSRVNLEDALKAGDHMGGHIVQGHVDCIGKIIAVKNIPNEFSIEVGINPKDAHLVVEKGSIAVDGVGLTVGEVTERSFKVYLIPHTRKITTLGQYKAGDAVNIEFDVVGKYISRSRELEKKGSGVSEELLRRANFI